MDLIYAQAVFTIVAATSQNANAGLPKLHNPNMSLPQKLCQVGRNLNIMTEIDARQSQYLKIPGGRGDGRAKKTYFQSGSSCLPTPRFSGDVWKTAGQKKSSQNPRTLTTSQTVAVSSISTTPTSFLKRQQDSVSSTMRP